MDQKNLVAIAECLLENVKGLNTADEIQAKKARSAIMQSAKALMLETCDPVDHMKSELVKVSLYFKFRRETLVYSLS